MDALKYKSVAVKLDIWQLLKKLGAEDFRSVGKVIEFLTMQECKKRNIEWSMSTLLLPRAQW